MPFYYQSHTGCHHSFLITEKILFALAMYAIPNPKSCKSECIKFQIDAAQNQKQAIGGTDISNKRAVQSVSFSGSLTVEAALVMPIFLGAMLLLLGLFQVLSIQEQVDSYLCTTGRRLVAYSQSYEGSSTGNLYQLFYAGIGESGIDSENIVGGYLGIVLGLSQDEDTEILTLTADYVVKISGYFLGSQWTVMSDTVYVRAWVGGELDSEEISDSSTAYVYVATNGVVYHKSEECSYLLLSVCQVPLVTISSLRNIYGSRYVACERCGTYDGNTMVYITDTGRAWHTDVQCSGLKRSYQTMTEDEAISKGLKACSRCGG